MTTDISGLGEATQNKHGSVGLRCSRCGEQVPSMRFCVRCGNRLVSADLAKIFNGSERAAGYAEVDPAEQSAPSGDNAPREAETQAQEEPSDPELSLEETRWFRRIFGGLAGRPRPHQADSLDEHTELTGLDSLGHCEAAAVVDGEDTVAVTGPKRRRLVIALVAAGVGALILSAGVVVAVQQPAAPTSSPVTTTTLPGWAARAAWSSDAVDGPVGVSADGKLVGYAHGSTVTVVESASGRELASSDLDTKPQGGVFAVSVDDKPALLAYTKASVTVWSGPDAHAVTVPRDEGQQLQIHAGVPFLVSESGAAMLTSNAPRPVVSPRAGAAVLGVTADGAVQWASARGEIITAAVNGTVISTVPLEKPDGATGIASWVTATSHAVWVRWDQGNGASTVVAYDIKTGKGVAHVAANEALPTATSQTGGNVLVDGALFTSSGQQVALPKSFLPGQFVGDIPYGATNSGEPALLIDGKTTPVATPSVVPVALSADRGLVAMNDGHVSMYPSSNRESH